MTLSATASYAQPVVLTDGDGVFMPREGIDQMLNFNAAKPAVDSLTIRISFGGFDAIRLAQSFTSGVSGTITEVLLPLDCRTIVDQSVTVALHTTSNPITTPPTDGDDGNLVASVVTPLTATSKN